MFFCLIEMQFQGPISLAIATVWQENFFVHTITNDFELLFMLALNVFSLS